MQETIAVTPAGPIQPPMKTAQEEGSHAKPTGPRVFYSKGAHLTIGVSKGQRVVINGEHVRVDEQWVEFSPQADGFGQLVTDDPDIIAFMDKRCAEVGDVMLPQDYTKATTPLEIQLKQKDEEHNRLLSEHNRLIALLNEKGKLPK